MFDDDAEFENQYSFKSHSTQVAAVRQACQQSQELRTEDEVNAILDFVKNVKFFSKLDRIQQLALCRNMALEEIGGDCFVFKEGEVGDKFYIILSGSVTVHIPRSKSIAVAGDNDEALKKAEDDLKARLQTKSGAHGIMGNSAVFLEHGMGFGELALQSEAPRSATVISTEPTELLVITRALYEKHAGKAHREFMEDRIRFLRQVGCVEQSLQIGTFKVLDIKQMAGCLNEISVPGGEIAIQQGANVDNAIFVRSGQLAIVRAVDVEDVRKATGPKPAHKSEEEHSARNSVPLVSPHLQSYSPDVVQNLAKALNEQKAASAKARSDTNRSDKHSKGDFNCAKARRRTFFTHTTGVKANPQAAVGKVNSAFIRQESEKSANTIPSADVGEKAARTISLVTALPSEAFVNSKTGMRKRLSNTSSHWFKLRSALRQAMMVNTFLRTPEADGGSELEKAHKSIEHFMEVQQIRKRVAKMEKKHGFSRYTVNRRRTSAETEDRDHVHSASTVASPPRRMLLRVGTLNAFQVFGDITSKSPYPASLVCDAGAELYMITKNDCMRRLPKKLSEVIFSRSLTLPPDNQLLDMYRRTARWNHFKRGLQDEATVASRRRNHGSDVVANLEFLGIKAPSSVVSRSGPPSRRTAGALTPKDKIHFSQSSSVFLRRYAELNRDPRMQHTTGGTGLETRTGTVRTSKENERDPLDYFQDQMWDQLGADIGLNLDDSLAEEPLTPQVVIDCTSLPPVEETAPAWGDNGNKRPSSQNSTVRTPSPRGASILQPPAVQSARRARYQKGPSRANSIVSRPSSRQSSTTSTPPPPRLSSSWETSSLARPILTEQGRDSERTSSLIAHRPLDSLSNEAPVPATSPTSAKPRKTVVFDSAAVQLDINP